MRAAVCSHRVWINSENLDGKYIILLLLYFTPRIHPTRHRGKSVYTFILLYRERIAACIQHALAAAEYSV